jgi:hypothetical protein
MASERAWANVVAQWRKTLVLGNQQGDSLDLIWPDEEQLLVRTLGATNVPELGEGPADAVDEALAEAAAYAREWQIPGHEKFAAWCAAFREGRGTPDPLARTTIGANVDLVRPPGADEGLAPGAVWVQLVELLENTDADGGPWGAYAAALAALALHQGWAPSLMRGPDARARSSTFAWLLACVAWVLLRRARSYEPAAPPPAA